VPPTASGSVVSVTSGNSHTATVPSTSTATSARPLR
jgi:hypothetical protein